MSPGNLDPVEVFESLPEKLQQCFKTGAASARSKGESRNFCGNLHVEVACPSVTDLALWDSLDLEHRQGVRRQVQLDNYVMGMIHGMSNSLAATNVDYFSLTARLSIVL